MHHWCRGMIPVRLRPLRPLSCSAFPTCQCPWLVPVVPMGPCASWRWWFRSACVRFGLYRPCPWRGSHVSPAFRRVRAVWGMIPPLTRLPFSLLVSSCAFASLRPVFPVPGAGPPVSPCFCGPPPPAPLLSRSVLPPCPRCVSVFSCASAPFRSFVLSAMTVQCGPFLWPVGAGSLYAWSVVPCPSRSSHCPFWSPRAACPV